MNDPEAELKISLLGYFRKNGLPAEEIQVGLNKTPDILLCKGDQDETLLEVKQKEDNKKEIAELDADLQAGGVVLRSKPLSSWKRADDVVRNAIHQMRSVDPGHKALRAVWVHCVGHYGYVYAERLKATIYGTQKLFSDDILDLATCFYFHESTFFRRKDELDAVIVWHDNEAFLYLNDHSPRFQRVLESRLAKCFSTGLYYPAKFVAEPWCLMHDGIEPRVDDEVALTYLRKKYSLSHLQRMDLGHYSVRNRPEI